MGKDGSGIVKEEKLAEVATDLAYGSSVQLALDLRRTYPGDRGESLARDVEARAARAAMEFEELRLRLADAGVAVPSLMALRLDSSAVRRGLRVLVDALSGPLSDGYLASLVALLTDARISPTRGRLAAGGFAVNELRSARMMSVPLEEALGEAVRRTARMHSIDVMVAIIAESRRAKAAPYILAGLASCRGLRRHELLANPTVQQHRDLFASALRL